MVDIQEWSRSSGYNQIAFAQWGSSTHGWRRAKRPWPWSRQENGQQHPSRPSCGRFDGMSPKRYGGANKCHVSKQFEKMIEVRLGKVLRQRRTYKVIAFSREEALRSAAAIQESANNIRGAHPDHVVERHSFLSQHQLQNKRRVTKSISC